MQKEWKTEEEIWIEKQYDIYDRHLPSFKINRDLILDRLYMKHNFRSWYSPATDSARLSTSFWGYRPTWQIEKKHSNTSHRMNDRSVVFPEYNYKTKK